MADSRADQIRREQREYDELISKVGELTDQELARQKELEDSIKRNTKAQEAYLKRVLAGTNLNKRTTAAISQQLGELSSISSVYSNLTSLQSESLKLAKADLKNKIVHGRASEAEVEFINSIVGETTKLQGIQQKLAESDSDNLAAQQAIRDEYDATLQQTLEKIAAERAMGKITAGQADAMVSMVQSQNQQLAVAEQYATISKEAKSQIDSQIEAYDKMKKTIRGTLDTIRMTLQTPQAMIMGASVAAGKFVDAMGEVNKQTGMFIGSTAALSFVFDDAAGTLSQMAKLSGDVNKATFMSQLNTNVLATSMGIGGEEAATLVNAFGNLSGQSMETGENMVSAMGATARMKGVLPSQAMKDMAAATEAMAVYSKGTGENFANAAIQAAQLGISVADTAKMADTLLDFETSIEKELEASALLGKDLNLSRARELAYAGDLEGMTREILNQVGEFPDDPYQQKALADALGIGVAELKQMVANQENLNTASGKFEQTVGMANDYLRAIGEKFGGPIASGVTFFLGELIRAKMTAAAINGTSMFGGMGDKLKGMGSSIKGWFSTTGAPSAPTGPSTPPTSAPAANPGQQASSMTKFNPAQVIAGAAALLIVAAAVYVFAKAMQEFATVQPGAILMGIISLLALVGALALVGSIMMSGVGAVAIIAGAAAMLVIAAAMWVLGKALQEIAKVDPSALIQVGGALLLFGLMVAPLGLLAIPLMLAAAAMIMVGAASLVLGAGLIVLGTGLMLIGNGFSAITSGLPLLVEQIGAMAQIDFLPILGLAGALTALAMALGLVASMGLLALPVLAAVGLVAGGAAALMGGGGGAEKGGMLEEIKGLRNDLASGKIAVYMDGQLVTSKVANVASKNPVT